jgi:raffinose/stachyose/melibiose transport system substrate-binding protein
MKFGKPKGRIGAAIAGALAFSISLGGVVAPAQAATTTISWIVDDGEQTLVIAKAIATAFTKANPTIKVKIVKRIAGDANAIPTKVQAGTLEDVVSYNSGSLFQALNPAKNFVDLTKKSYMKEVSATFKPAVTVNKKVYGVPYGPMMAGGILYNKAVYKKLGLKVPKTWAQFQLNNAKIKKAGLTPVIMSYGGYDAWSTQSLFLGDFHNVKMAVPTFAAQYTLGKKKFADTPAALESFKKVEELADLGYYNDNASTTGFIDALSMLANGEGAHYAMATWALAYMPADKISDIGSFAVPGRSSASNGMTVWLPNAVYINAKTKKLAAAEKFLAFLVSKAGTDTYTKAGGYTGPYLTSKQSPAPKTAPAAITDAMKYVNARKTTAALEFVTPLKGANLPQIIVSIASGQTTALEGAKLYDEDARKMAKQLGLKGW